MATPTSRTLGAAIATAVAGSMLLVPTTAQAAPAYNGERNVTVELNTPNRFKLNRNNSVVIRVDSEAGTPKGLIRITFRRQNGTVISRKFCRLGADSQCAVNFKAPRRGKAGYMNAKYMGNKRFESETAAKRFKYKRRNAD